MRAVTQSKSHQKPLHPERQSRSKAAEFLYFYLSILGNLGKYILRIKIDFKKNSVTDGGRLPRLPRAPETCQMRNRATIRTLQRGLREIQLEGQGVFQVLFVNALDLARIFAHTAGPRSGVNFEHRLTVPTQT